MPRRLFLLLAICCLVSCKKAATDATVMAITPPQDAWFDENVASQTTPVLVDFTAKWCGPCQMLKPYLEQLEKEHPGKVKVVPIDIDARGDLASHYQVRSYPTLLMMQGGKVIDICRGAPPTYEDLKEWASPHLK